jgi:hypothetical protein
MAPTERIKCLLQVRQPVRTLIPDVMTSVVNNGVTTLMTLMMVSIINGDGDCVKSPACCPVVQVTLVMLIMMSMIAMTVTRSSGAIESH